MIQVSSLLLKFIIVNYCGIKIIESSSDLNNHDEKDSSEISQKNFTWYSIRATFPGTRWCGPGDTALNYDDLGEFREADKCCRDHDHCDYISGGGSKYGLKNYDLFTKLHCKCDKKFKECLHAVNRYEADIIGKQYFIARNQCYKEDYPIIGCVKYQRRKLLRRCIRYKVDTSKNRIYQWFDLPFYD